MSLKIPQFQSRVNNQEDRQSGSPANALLNGAGTGAIVGYLVGGSGKETSAQDLLKKFGGEKADDFIKSIPDFETLPETEKAKLNYIKNLLAYKDTSIQELEEATKKLFGKHKEISLRKFISKVPIKQIFPQLDLIGKLYGARAAIGLAATSIWVINNPWSLIFASLFLGKNFRRYRYPNLRLGDYVDNLPAMERNTALKTKNSAQKVNSATKINDAMKKLIKLKSIRAIFSSMHLEFYKRKHADKITQETALNIIKEAKEASDKTIFAEIEENMQGLSKYLKKSSGLKTIGIGALIGALAFGILAVGGKKIQKNNQDK